MTLWSNSSWAAHANCPHAYGYRHVRRLQTRADIAQALTFGKAWHQVARAFLECSEAAPDDPLLASMLSFWTMHNAPNYWDPSGDAEVISQYHEVVFVFDRNGKLMLKSLDKLPSTGLCGVMDTISFLPDRIEIIERKTTSTADPKWEQYRAMTQYWTYVHLADELRRITGLPVLIHYDVVRKAVPRDPQGLTCKKCHGDNPACPVCYGTNVIGIGKSVTQFDRPTLDAWIAKYPHAMNHPKSIEFMNQFQPAEFNFWFTDCEDDRIFARRQFEDFLQSIRRARVQTYRTFQNCGSCDFMRPCWRIEFEEFSFEVDPEIDPAKPSMLPAECAFRDLNPLTVGQLLLVEYPALAPKPRKALKS